MYPVSEFLNLQRGRCRVCGLSGSLHEGVSHSYRYGVPSERPWWLGRNQALPRDCPPMSADLVTRSFAADVSETEIPLTFGPLLRRHA